MALRLARNPGIIRVSSRLQGGCVTGLASGAPLALDAVGNRTALTTTAGTTEYAYDAADRLASIDSVPVTYDSRGNLTSDGTWTYTYNAAGRMVRAESISATQVYTYNGDGLLVAQSLDGLETAFTWDQALGIPQVLATSGGVRSVYGLGRLAVEQGEAWYYPQVDALGSVRQWTGALAAVLAAQSYSPYGEPRSGLNVAPWGFTGEWHDPTELVDLRARWYNVALGRFTQVDPRPGEATRPLSRHAYTYAWANPLRRLDPTGRSVPIEGGSLKPVVPEGSPLSSEQLAIAKVVADRFDIPYEFLAGVLRVQRVYDYDRQDELEDALVQGLLLANKAQLYPGVDPNLSAIELWLLCRISDVAGRLQMGQLSTGLGQIQLGTAKLMDEYFAASGLICQSRSEIELLRKLQSDYGNIQYVAAYLRFLADVREQNGGPRLEASDLGSMQVIYGAYRAGILAAYPSEEAFAKTPRPEEGAVWGPLLTEQTVGLYR